MTLMPHCTIRLENQTVLQVDSQSFTQNCGSSSDRGTSNFYPTSCHTFTQRCAQLLQMSPWCVSSVFPPSSITVRGGKEGSQGSSLITVSRLRAGKTGVRFLVGVAIIFPSPVLGPTQPHIKCVLVTLSPVVQQPGREADYSPPSSAEGENAWSHTSTSPIRLQGVTIN
jgi:hypothetical protein